MIRIIIFASGSGTNAENIIKHFENSPEVEVKYVLSNNSKAGVLDRAKRLKVPFRSFTKNEMHSDKFLDFLKSEADFIILAGFLLKIPTSIINSFKDSMINIHPALLPSYGGKGMYGMHVHRAIVDNKEAKSGITIHFVNEHYDEGAIIFQKSVSIDPKDSPEDVAAKIHILEQENFPLVIENLLKSRNES